MYLVDRSRSLWKTQLLQQNLFHRYSTKLQHSCQPLCTQKSPNGLWLLLLCFDHKPQTARNGRLVHLQ